MNVNLLELAKTHQKEQRWEPASKFFKQYIDATDGKCEDNVYVAYAQTLRFSGYTERAKNILAEGLRVHPDSELLLQEQHNLCDFLGDWHMARKIAASLVKRFPEKADHHFRLGKTESFLLNYSKAKKSYRLGLQHKHQLPLEQLMDEIKRGFTGSPEKFHSKYIFIDGKNNLGAFIHRNADHSLFTKISIYTNHTNGAGREAGFYQRLCKDFPVLKKLAPEYADMQIVDGISYLTMEKINALAVEPQNLEQIIETSQRISSVRYGKLAGAYPLPGYAFQFRKGRAISVVHFFTQIHKEEYNQKLFHAVGLIMKQHKYPNSIRQVMARLETAIMDQKLYQLMEPEKHFSLLHGDFAHQNVLIDQKNGNPFVIDWTSYTIGPHFVDLARFFSSSLLPYSDIKELYLQKTGTSLSTIEHIFFLYALVLFYFQKLGRMGIETELSQFILPALEDLELLALTLKISKEDEDISMEIKELQETELRVKQMEQKIALLEDERKHLHKRLHDMINSKSWKLTAPLRLFMERKTLKN